MEPLRKEGKQMRFPPLQVRQMQAPQWSPSERRGSRGSISSPETTRFAPQWSPSERRGSRTGGSPAATVELLVPQWSPSERRGSSAATMAPCTPPVGRLNGAPPKGGEAVDPGSPAPPPPPASLNGAPPKGGEAGEARSSGVHHRDGASMEPLRKEGKQPTSLSSRRRKPSCLNGAPPKGGEAGLGEFASTDLRIRGRWRAVR